MASESKAADKPRKRGKVKETFAELKKVTWPTFGKTMKQTGAVFVVTIFFLVILLVMDQLLGLAHSQLVEGLKPPAEEALQTIAATIRGGWANFVSHVPALPLRI